MHRRYRLTRSHDFDAVYRRGRSVSTRFLVLYWFPREDTDEDAAARPRGAEARRHRRSRGTASSAGCARRGGRGSSRFPAACDYVLVVRPGFVEAAENRGAEWVDERLDEVLGKAAA